MSRWLACSVAVAFIACGPPPAPPSSPSSMVVPPLSGVDAGPRQARDLPAKRPTWLPKRLAVAEHGMCVIHDGDLYCRHRGNDEVLPLVGLFDSRNHVPLPHRATDVAMASHHTCAVTGDGQLYCWGSNQDGQLGTGHTEAQSQPVPVPGLERVVEVATSDRHTCARQTDGRVACWGSNLFGEAGHDTGFVDNAAQLVRPVYVAGLSDVDRIWMKHLRSCARVAGVAYCWGGEEGTASPALPKPTRGQDDPFLLNQQERRCKWRRGRTYQVCGWTRDPQPMTRRVLTGNLDCALYVDRRMRCRHRTYGYAGSPRQEAPLPELENVRDLSGSDTSGRVCALADHEVYCWGGLGRSEGVVERLALPTR